MEHAVLCVQLADWKNFRQFQKKTRDHFLRFKTLSALEGRIRECRQRHNLKGEVCLQPELKNQSRLANWIEFQDYHLHRQEEFAKDFDDSKTKLADAQRRLEVGDATNPERAIQDVEGRQYDLEYSERRFEKQKILLQWIEQEYIEMSVDKHLDDQNSTPKGAQTVSAHGHRMRPSKARSVISASWAGISKPVPKNALSPFRSLRVSKVQRSAEANTKPPPETQLHKLSQKQSDLARCEQQKASP